MKFLYVLYINNSSLTFFYIIFKIILKVTGINKKSKVKVNQ